MKVSLVPRLSVQLFFARSKISWTESLGTKLGESVDCVDIGQGVVEGGVCIGSG